jgi:predicted secreted Zn-dependent protease
MPINKTSKGWKIVNVKGYSKTKKEAEQRLKAVKASQARRGRNK